MGKVFTAEEVQQGLIPRLEDFVVVRNKLVAALTAESAVESALVFGSLVRDDHTIRSDLDCAVVYDWDAHEGVFNLLGRLATEAAQLYVPLNLESCDSGTAKTRFHRFGPSFREHLNKAQKAGGGIKGDVCKHFGPSVPVKQELESYLGHKLSKLQIGRTNYRAQDAHAQAHYLQKMLEAPIHVARKTLTYLGKLDGDSKADVSRMYTSVIGGERAEQLGSLRLLDEAYSEMLVRSLENKAIDDYEEGLRRFFDCADNAIKFVRDNIGIIRRFEDTAAR